MRAACRRFMDDATEADEPHRDRDRLHFYRFENVALGIALGEFRSAMAPHIAAIAVAFDLDVEDELASMLPPANDAT